MEEIQGAMGPQGGVRNIKFKMTGVNFYPKNVTCKNMLQQNFLANFFTGVGPLAP